LWARMGRKLWFSRVYRTTKHIIDHFGDGFFRVKWLSQQCQSTGGSSSPKDRLQSYQVHLTVLQAYACIQHTVIHHTKMNLSKVKWTQWDKTQSRELLGLFICVCIALCTIAAHNIAQNRPDNFPLTLQTITIAPMMSIWAKGGLAESITCYMGGPDLPCEVKGQFWWIGAPVVKYRHFLP